MGGKGTGGMHPYIGGIRGTGLPSVNVGRLLGLSLTNKW
jgi:hypothetical protein